MRPIDLNKIKTGSLVIITNTKNCIEGFENINEKEPVDVIFVNKKYYINSLGVSHADAVASKRWDIPKEI